MKLGNCCAILGFLAASSGAVAVAPGCTATSSICSGSTCPEYDGSVTPPPASGDSGATPDDAGVVVEPDGSAPADPCNACLYAQCVGQYTDCLGNASCLALYECATAPACTADGGTCTDACYASSDEKGQAIYLTLAACDNAAECPNPSTAPCAATCNVTCANVGDSGAAEDSAAEADAGGDAGSCTDCQSAMCASELATCAAGTACATYDQCVLSCTDTACDSACAADNPPGSAAATALGTCTSSSCPQCF